MSATAYEPIPVPPICGLCEHGSPVGQVLECHCPALVERFGRQPARVMRSRDDACGDATHRSIKFPYVEH